MPLAWGLTRETRHSQEGGRTGGDALHGPGPQDETLGVLDALDEAGDGAVRGVDLQLARARTFIRAGRLGEAHTELSSVIDSDAARDEPRTRVLALIGRAHVLMDSWEHTRALRDAHAAVETLSHHHAYATRALVFQRLGQLGRAYADFTRAVQLWSAADSSPTVLAQILGARADILDELGRADEAELDRERAREARAAVAAGRDDQASSGWSRR